MLVQPSQVGANFINISFTNLTINSTVFSTQHFKTIFSNIYFLLTNSCPNAFVIKPNIADTKKHPFTMILYFQYKSISNTHLHLHIGNNSA